MENNLKNDPRYQNHESRPDLAGEHPLGDRFQLLAFFIFVVALLIDHFWVGWGSNLRHLIPLVIRILFGVSLIALGGYLSLFGIRYVFTEYSHEPRMYTSGLFAHVRHPIYLGALVVYIGLLCIILSPLGLLVFILIFFLYDWLARDEEERMLKIFGSRYEDYMMQTPRWIPFCSKQG